MKYRGLFMTLIPILVAAGVFAQGHRPLTADDVQYLLRQSVSPERVAALVEERGISFRPTASLMENLRKAGAGAALLAAVERASAKTKARSKREILDLAKSEAKVVWYTSLLSPLPEALCNRFTAATPEIACEVHRSGSGNLFNRLSGEMKSGVYRADVYHSSNVDDFVRLRGNQALMRYRPEGIGSFDASFMDKDNSWAMMRGGLFVPAYNKKKLSVKQVPQRWLDFFDPEFGGGKLAMGDPLASGFVNVGLASLGYRFGWGFLDKLFGQKPRILRSAPEAMGQLRSGETILLFGAINYSIHQEITNRAPIAYIRPEEGVPFVAAPQGILANAPHPNAAMVFTDWLFSREAQQLLADQGLYVGHPAVTYPENQMRLRDLRILTLPHTDASASYEKVRAMFREKMFP